MERNNLSDNSPKVVKQTVNLGNSPYFSDVDDSGKRMVMFHQDSIVKLTGQPSQEDKNNRLCQHPLWWLRHCLYCL
jgi:hypothetical protein